MGTQDPDAYVKHSKEKVEKDFRRILDDKRDTGRSVFYINVKLGLATLLE